MKNTTQLEKEVLSLPPEERAHLVLAAWESLESDPAFAADRNFDAEGLRTATERDCEIESGAVKPLTQEEFRTRTRSANK